MSTTTSMFEAGLRQVTSPSPVEHVEGRIRSESAAEIINCTSAAGLPARLAAGLSAGGEGAADEGAPDSWSALDLAPRTWPLPADPWWRTPTTSSATATTSMTATKASSKPLNRPCRSSAGRTVGRTVGRAVSGGR